MPFAVILAAGTSTRFANSAPVGSPAGSKVFWELLPGCPLWKISFELFKRHPKITGVGIVSHKSEISRFEGHGADFVVAGGETRAQSSLLGVSAVPEKEEIVLVHDAARPALSSRLISRVIDATERFGAAIPVLPISDTVRYGESWAGEMVDRTNLFRVQTPQGANRKELLRALCDNPNVPDEAAALQGIGKDVALVEGETWNEKVTEYRDLGSVSGRLFTRVPIVGMGYDIHSFSNDTSRKLVLGGVTIEGEAGLAGHSDADVLIHALVDAILGSIGAGDIGQLFPDTDAKWKNADSRIFLREANRLFKTANAEYSNLDVTVIAERPRLGENRQKIREAISSELGIIPDRVNIKATTHERLGALGRGEGIACYAVVSGCILRNNLEE